MKTEAQFKQHFKRSAIRQKGFSLSLTQPTIVGLPDLYVVMPEYIPVLLEAKWLGDIKKDKFKRKVPFTPMQIHWLTECDKVSPYTAMGLVGFNYMGTYWAVLVKPNGVGFQQMNNEILKTLPRAVCTKGTLFDVMGLFAEVPIPKIQVSEDKCKTHFQTLTTDPNHANQAA